MHHKLIFFGSKLKKVTPLSTSILIILLIVSIGNNQALNLHFQTNINISKIGLNYTSHGPIVIDGNTEFHTTAMSESWLGSGSSDDPYIIEGYSITVSGWDDALIIQNTNLYFIFKGNLLDGTSPFCSDIPDCNNGIILNNVTNAEITEITIINFFRGVYLSSSSNVEIIENEINSNARGIELDFSDYNEITNNSVYSNDEYGLWIKASNNNNFYNNSIFQNTWEGIRIQPDDTVSYASYNNSVVSNTVYNNPDNNIYIRNSHFTNISKNTAYGGFYGILSSGLNNSVTENTVYDNYNGIRISHDNNTVFDNVIHNNTDGIFLNFASNTVINKNSIYHNTQGIHLWYSDYNFVHDNWIHNNTEFGVRFYFSNNVSIVSNQIYYNPEGIQLAGISANNSINFNAIYENNRYGLHLGDVDNPGVWSSDDNNISNNQIHDNRIGLYINVSDYNNIQYNAVYDNLIDGMGIDPVGEYNTIFQNTFEGNGDFGLNISGSHNLIKNNDFLENQNLKSQAQDNGINNTFNLNYWDDHNNTDSDGDGIAEEPYNITGSAGNRDLNPLTVPNTLHTLLSPTIIYPIGGEILTSIVNVQWQEAFDNFNHLVNYDLFVSPDNGISWELVVSGLVSTSYMWNTSNHPNGDYLLKITASDDYGLSSSITTQGTFEIANHYLIAPQIIFPNGGEILKDIVSIQWEEAEDSFDHEIVYKIYHSPNDGDTWSIIGENIVRGEFPWDTSTVPEGDRNKIRVEVNDGNGLTAEDTSDGVFTIDQSSLANDTTADTTPEDSGIDSSPTLLYFTGFFIFPIVMTLIVYFRRNKLIRM